MPPKVEFDAGFDEDLDGATDFLIARSQELADRFGKDFEATVEHLFEYPHSGVRGSHGTRSMRIGKGPYSLVYLVNESGTYVRFLALAHSSRDQGYWRDRL